VRELIPLHPDRMEVIQRPDLELEFLHTNAQGARVSYSSEDIFRVFGLTSNGYDGLSPIAQQRETIGMTKAAEQLSAQLFGNGAKPNAGLKHPKHLSQEAYDRLKESLNDEYNGANALGTLILEEGLEWVKIGVDPRDAQFIETMKLGVEAIARMYRIPPHKIQHLDRSTNNNIEHQAIEYVTDTMQPWAVNWEQAILRDLVPESEQDRFYPEFALEGLLRGDSKARVEFYKGMFEVGAFSPNMILERENENPVDGGDRRWIPMNMQELTDGQEPKTP
jgi:HK97 family phage portal protein